MICKKRIGSVDLARFLMILLIMAHHLYLFGYADGYLGESCWAWVDYFFILTGYFTMSHFTAYEGKDSYAKEALIYTLKKFKGFMPYVFAAVVLQYFLEALPYLLQHDVRLFIDSFVDLPYELLLLSSSGIVWSKLAPIWFLSAMLLTLPVLIYLLLRFKDLWRILCWLLPVMYYGRYGINTSRAWPNDLLRAFSGMALGTFVYIMAYELNKMQSSAKRRLIFTIVELCSFGIGVFITVWNKDCMNLLILLFVLNAGIMLSGYSYTSNLRGPFWDFLGKISLPMFIFHWAIGTIVGRIFTENIIRVWIYYLATVMVSVIVIGGKEMFLKKHIGIAQVRQGK